MFCNSPNLLELRQNSEIPWNRPLRRAQGFLVWIVDLCSVWLVHNAVFANGENERVFNKQQESLDFSGGGAGMLGNYVELQVFEVGHSHTFLSCYNVVISKYR